MAYMVWKKEYSVDVSEIDAQHRRMFAIINELEQALCDGQAMRILERIFNQMADYAQVHFRTEEEYFRQCSYEGQLEHVTEHHDFEEKIVQFKESLARNSDTNVYIRYLSVEVMKFLRKWWVNHICINDKKYMKVFKEHNLS